MLVWSLIRSHIHRHSGLWSVVCFKRASTNSETTSQSCRSHPYQEKKVIQVVLGLHRLLLRFRIDYELAWALKRSGGNVLLIFWQVWSHAERFVKPSLCLVYFWFLGPNAVEALRVWPRNKKVLMEKKHRPCQSDRATLANLVRRRVPVCRRGQFSQCPVM